VLGDFGNRFGNRCLVFVGRTSDVDVEALSPDRLSGVVTEVSSHHDDLAGTALNVDDEVASAERLMRPANFIEAVVKGKATMSDVRYVELHGCRVAYREAGSGEVVLLIHGMAGSSDAWRAVLPELAKHYRVIAPDLLGHGQSDKPRTDFSLGAFAASLRDSPHQAEVQHRWRHLLALRGFDTDRNGGAKGRPVRVRYGLENSSTIC
jgi:hypothetical protein